MQRTFKVINISQFKDRVLQYRPVCQFSWLYSERLYFCTQKQRVQFLGDRL